MSEIHILLLCGLFFMPIAVIIAMGVFWAYIWVKDGLNQAVKDFEGYPWIGRPTPEELDKMINQISNTKEFKRKVKKK